MSKVDWAAIEWRDKKVFAVHRINMPDSKDSGWYRSVVSIQAFHNRELNRFAKEVTDADGRTWAQARTPEPSRWFSLDHWSERSYALDDGPLVHQSLWAFYEAIGYDYQNRRYTMEPVSYEPGIDNGSPTP